LQFELFTGGGGDADEDGYGTRIEAARKGGLHVGNLTAKTLAKWYDLGWYDLFNSRCIMKTSALYPISLMKYYSHGKSPKVTRSVIYSSGKPLSDLDSDLAAGDTGSDSDDSDISPVKTAPSLKHKPSREASKFLEP
jgi:hypothetical protein